MVAQPGIGDEGRAGGFLDILYREYKNSLCAYIRQNFGPGPPEPSDIAQEAFLRLAANIGSVSNPKAFLMRAARNLAIDAYRKQARGRTVLRSVAILEEKGHEADVSDVLSSREELQRLAAIVDMLKPRQRVAFLMHRVDGLSFVDIGRRLGISQSGARLLVDNALATCVAKMRKTGK